VSVIWLVAGVLLVIAELFTLDFVLIMLAAGAFAAAVAGLVGPLPVQVVVFAAVSVLGLAAVRPAIKRHLHQDNLKVAVVTKGADAFLNDVINNTPSPITYEAEGIPQSVIDEDKAVAVYRLNVNKAASKIVDVSEMFK